MNDCQSLGLHRLWKRRVLKLADAGPGQRALDLCCGTGDLARGLARAGASVIAVDFSLAMLEVARGRTPSAAPGRALIQYLHGDALHLPFRNAVFDVVTVGYGLRNLADLTRGLAELARVTAPHARVVILDFGRPHHRLWRAGYFWYLRQVVPLLGSAFAANREAYGYILPSLERYPARDAIARQLTDAGFTSAHATLIFGGAMTIHCAVK